MQVSIYVCSCKGIIFGITLLSIHFSSLSLIFTPNLPHHPQDYKIKKE